MVRQASVLRALVGVSLWKCADAWVRQASVLRALVGVSLWKCADAWVRFILAARSRLEATGPWPVF